MTYDRPCGFWAIIACPWRMLGILLPKERGNSNSSISEGLVLQGSYRQAFARRWCLQRWRTLSGYNHRVLEQDCLGSDPDCIMKLTGSLGQVMWSMPQLSLLWAGDGDSIYFKRTKCIWRILDWHVSYGNWAVNMRSVNPIVWYH